MYGLDSDTRSALTEHLLNSNGRLQNLYHITNKKRTVSTAPFVLSNVIGKSFTFHVCILFCGARGGVVVKELRYKRVGRGFDSRWCHWTFSVT